MSVGTMNYAQRVGTKDTRPKSNELGPLYVVCPAKGCFYAARTLGPRAQAVDALALHFFKVHQKHYGPSDGLSLLNQQRRW